MLNAEPVKVFDSAFRIQNSEFVFLSDLRASAVNLEFFA
jgi:hypothetical protein